MTGQATAFLVNNKAAIDDLVTKIVDGAMKGMPCLSVHNPRGRLNALIEKVVMARFDGGEGCTGAWDADGVFVVTVEDGMTPGETRVGASLFLGETWIKP